MKNTIQKLPLLLTPGVCFILCAILIIVGIGDGLPSLSGIGDGVPSFTKGIGDNVPKFASIGDGVSSLTNAVGGDLPSVAVSNFLQTTSIGDGIPVIGLDTDRPNYVAGVGDSIPRLIGIGDNFPGNIAAVGDGLPS